MEQEQIKEFISDIKEIRKIVGENYTGLHNHITHLDADIKVIRTEILWLKEMKDDFKILREYIFENRPQKDNEDTRQNANIEWNSWFMRVLITAGISAMVAIITALLLR